MRSLADYGLDFPADHGADLIGRLASPPGPFRARRLKPVTERQDCTNRRRETAQRRAPSRAPRRGAAPRRQRRSREDERPPVEPAPESPEDLPPIASNHIARPPKERSRSPTLRCKSRPLRAAACRCRAYLPSPRGRESARPGGGGAERAYYRIAVAAVTTTFSSGLTRASDRVVRRHETIRHRGGLD